MYNLEIETTHNFTTSGYISHNCLDPLFDAIDIGIVKKSGGLSSNQFD